MNLGGIRPLTRRPKPPQRRPDAPVFEGVVGGKVAVVREHPRGGYTLELGGARRPGRFETTTGLVTTKKAKTSRCVILREFYKKGCAQRTRLSLPSDPDPYARATPAQ